MNCGNCVYCKPYDKKIGRCRRYPPTQDHKGIRSIDKQPTVSLDGWCGEHKKGE